MKELGRIEIEQYKPLRDIVFETLRTAILDGKLKPGERVMEVQLAEKLGGEIVQCNFLIEIEFLNGINKLKNQNVKSLLKF